MPSTALIDELLATLGAGLPSACCTVVATRGSTPQKAGAMMLVYADGRQSGTLGGGCVEAEVRRRALETLNAGTLRPSFHTFTLDDDYGWDDGLICGGRMTILVDPLDADARSYFSELRAMAAGGRGWNEVFPLDASAAPRYLLDAEGRCRAALRGRCDDPIPHPGRGAAHLRVPPRIRLLIVGGGHVGQAVATLAHEVDFEVWVLDDRDSAISPERFPHATRRILGDIGHKLAELRQEFTPTVFALIVTRGHNHDEEALFHLAPTSAGYVGMIGSRRKVKLIFDDLLAKGIPDEALARVRAPVGLEIGSESVAEIAVSIVAQLIACRSGKAGV
jgi:xanthine dehydrogenase accessory factor